MIQSALVSTRPARLQKVAEVSRIGAESVGDMLRRYHVPAEWGDPIVNCAWLDVHGRVLAVNAGYANGSVAFFRQYATTWKLTFGRDEALVQGKAREEA
jgi:hypothetical protein